MTDGQESGEGHDPAQMAHRCTGVELDVEGPTNCLERESVILAKYAGHGPITCWVRRWEVR